MGEKMKSQLANTDLVGGIPTPLKNMSSSMGMIIPYKKWKMKFMFQTTNQTSIYQYFTYTDRKPVFNTIYQLMIR